MKYFIFINILWCVFVVSLMSCRRILLVNFTSTDLSTKKFIVDSGIIFIKYQDIKDYVKLKLVLFSDDFNIEVLNSQRGIYESVSLSSYFIWESGFLSILISNIIFDNNANNSTSNSQRLAIKGRLFDINTNILTIQKHVIRINEGISTAHLGTGLNTWDCSIVLAKYLESNRYLIKDKQVLELGSGTGIAGIAALILQSRFVRLTDLKYTISNLLSNVEFNVDSHQNETYLKSNLEHSTAVSSVKKRYVVSELDWGDEQTFPRDENGDVEQYDVILGADIVWLEHLIPSLIHALKTIMNDSSMFIFAYQSRSKRTDDVLFNLLKADFLVFKVNRSKSQSMKIGNDEEDNDEKEEEEEKEEQETTYYTSDIINIYHIYKLSSNILFNNEYQNEQYSNLL